MTALVARTIQETKPLTIIQRLAEKDQTAVTDCIDAYGNFIWALARKFTASSEEAEAAAQEIFIDIWRYAERTDQTQSHENLLIALIARRRLVKHLQ
jgi:DNA-directed RNA polymerase specialized sigma24 family protein